MKVINEEVANLFLQKLGENIAKIRKEKNILQTDLADLCIVQPSSVSRAERGGIDIRIVTLLKAANGLNIPFNKLFDFPEIDYCVKNIITEKPENKKEPH